VERDLVERVRAGDAEALGEIVRATSPKLVSFAFGFTRSRDVAEDIVQDVFLAVWNRRAEWTPQSVMAYLLASVRNRAFKVARARRVEDRHRDTAGAAIVAGTVAPSPDMVFEEDADRRRWVVRLRALHDELDRLSERQRSAYLLRYEQGLTIPQIASVLEISVKGAEQLVRRTTHALREKLGRLREE